MDAIVPGHHRDLGQKWSRDTRSKLKCKSINLPQKGSQPFNVQLKQRATDGSTPK
jgi:hypothetical protein